MNQDSNIFFNQDEMMSNQNEVERSYCSFCHNHFCNQHQDYESFLSTQLNTPERLAYRLEPLELQSDFLCFTQNRTWMLFSNDHRGTMGQVQLNGDFQLPQLPRKNSGSQQKEENTQTKIPNHCEKCNKTFPTHRGLGGHVSRVHKNSSTKYIHKMETFKRRTQARENKSKLCALIQNITTNMVIQ